MSESSDRVIGPEEAGRPPSPPEVGRGYGLHWYQYVGLPLLLLIVVLALAGAFGESWEEGSADGEVLSLAWRYPTKMRYKQLNSVQLRVSNTSAARLDTVHVSFDPAYLNAFSTVKATPSFTEAWSIPLTDVRPGASRLVVVAIQGERYWRHTGRLSAAAGQDTVEAELATVMFP